MKRPTIYLSLDQILHVLSKQFRFFSQFFYANFFEYLLKNKKSLVFAIEQEMCLFTSRLAANVAH